MNLRRVISGALGAVFVVSALSKVVNVPAFATLTRDFMTLAGMGWLVTYALPVSVAVCSVELLLGVMMFGQYKCIALVGIIAMLIGFTWITWINLTDMYGGIESCGCFGELIHFSPLGSFVKNIVLLTASISLYILKSTTKAMADKIQR